MRSPDPEAVERFWETAGRAGYQDVLYPSRRIAAHVEGRRWRIALEMARLIGIDDGGEVLDLGCGEGEFAADALAPHFRRVDALDRSRAAIERARARPHADHVHFAIGDLATREFPAGQRWDGAFLLGVLNYVRLAAPAIVARLAPVAPRVVVIEPNGDNVGRRVLERLPVLRRAGAASFRLQELDAVFRQAGYRLRAHRRFNLFLAFVPAPLFPAMAGLERWVEAHPSWHWLCSTRVYGFVRDP